MYGVIHWSEATFDLKSEYLVRFDSEAPAKARKVGRILEQYGDFGYTSYDFPAGIDFDPIGGKLYMVTLNNEVDVSGQGVKQLGGIKVFTIDPAAVAASLVLELQPNSLVVLGQKLDLEKTDVAFCPKTQNLHIVAGKIHLVYDVQQGSYIRLRDFPKEMSAIAFSQRADGVVTPYVIQEEDGQLCTIRDWEALLSEGNFSTDIHHSLSQVADLERVAIIEGAGIKSPNGFTIDGVTGYYLVNLSGTGEEYDPTLFQMGLSSPIQPISKGNFGSSRHSELQGNGSDVSYWYWQSMDIMGLAIAPEEEPVPEPTEEPIPEPAVTPNSSPDVAEPSVPVVPESPVPAVEESPIAQPVASLAPVSWVVKRGGYKAKTKALPVSGTHYLVSIKVRAKKQGAFRRWKLRLSHSGGLVLVTRNMAKLKRRGARYFVSPKKAVKGRKFKVKLLVPSPVHPQALVVRP